MVKTLDQAKRIYENRKRRQTIPVAVKRFLKREGLGILYVTGATLQTRQT